MLASTTLCCHSDNVPLPRSATHLKLSTSVGVLSHHNIFKEKAQTHHHHHHAAMIQSIHQTKPKQQQNQEREEMVHLGKRVRFASTLVSDVWVRPRTARGDVRTLYYVAEDFQRFRYEIRCDMMCLSEGVIGSSSSALEFNVLTAAAAMVLSIILLLGSIMCSMEERYRESIYPSHAAHPKKRGCTTEQQNQQQLAKIRELTQQQQRQQVRTNLVNQNTCSKKGV